MEDIEKSRAYLNQALQMCRNVYGEKNATTAETYRQSADCCVKNKEDEKA